MAATANDKSKKLMDAYNQAISSAFAATDAGFVQGAAAVKTFSDAAEAERRELGKVSAQAAACASARSENLAAVMQGMMAPSVPSPDQAKEAIGKIVEGEMDFYQSLVKGWMDYLTGLESRRSAVAQAVIESNSGAIESGQAAVKSATNYGQALLDWAFSAAPATGAAKGGKG